MFDIKQLLLKLTKWVERLEDTILVFILLSMLSLAITQIVLRNLFDSGIIWGDSLLRVLVLWITLLGAIVASRHNNHISIDLLTRFIAEKNRWILSAITSLFTASICGLLAWHSYRFVEIEYLDSITAFANVPTWVCELILPIGFTIIALRYSLHAITSSTLRQNLSPRSDS